MEERKKLRCFQLDLNLIELVCTLKKVGLTISQMFIALDLSSVLTLDLNNNFPKRKKQVLNKQLLEAQILSEILTRDDTAVLLVRFTGLSGVQFHDKFRSNDSIQFHRSF